MTSTPVATHRLQRAIYRQLLRVLPARIRHDYGTDMECLFHSHLMATRGDLGNRIAVWFGAVTDLARHGASLYRKPHRPVFPSGRRQHGVTTMSERLRSLLDATVRDAVYGARLLRKDWTFTLTTTLILGLAIGANTAIFSFVDTYILRPLPYPNPERLATVARVYPGNFTDGSQDGRTWEEIRDAAIPGLQTAVYSGWGSSVNLAMGNSAVSVSQQRVGAGYFDTLGVPPMLGREFTAAEDVPDGPAVTILSHALWRTLFNEARSAIGQTVLLRGEPYTVVGIMPPNFRSRAQADLWIPLRASTRGEGGGTNFGILARLDAGTSWLGAATAVNAVGLELLDSGYEGSRFEGLTLVSLQESDTRSVRRTMTILSLSVAAVLLIACVNVSGLLLVRSSQRGREIATRMAIGGGRAAMVRQLLIESLLLATLGGVAGVVIGRGMLEGLSSLGRGVLTSWRPVSLDGRVLLGTALISLLTAILFGLAPGLQAGRVSINEALRAAGGRGSTGASRWGRRLLVVTEVGVSVVLLVMAGLLLRTFLYLQNLEPGFDGEGLVAVSVSLQDARYETREQAEALFTEGVRRVSNLPSVDSAAASLGLPFQRLLNLQFGPLDFELPEGRNTITNVSYATAGFFETVGMQVYQGRGIEVIDDAAAEPVAVVNEAFARLYMPGIEPVGRSLALAGADRRIVGVVASVQQERSFGNFEPLAQMPAVYISASQVSGEFLKLVHTWFSPTWIVRVVGDPAVAIPEIERQLAGVDPLLPLVSTRLISEIQSGSIQEQRFVATLVALLAVASIVLAALGIYGLVANSVTEQQREIGIRLALGARARDALSVAAMPSIKLAIVGAALGVLGSIAAGRALTAVLWGVTPADPWTYGGVAVALVVAASVASLIPASRAARLDPARTLQAD